MVGPFHHWTDAVLPAGIDYDAIPSPAPRRILAPLPAPPRAAPSLLFSRPMPCIFPTAGCGPRLARRLSGYAAWLKEHVLNGHARPSLMYLHWSPRGFPPVFRGSLFGPIAPSSSGYFPPPFASFPGGSSSSSSLFLFSVFFFFFSASFFCLPAGWSPGFFSTFAFCPAPMTRAFWIS